MIQDHAYFDDGCQSAPAEMGLIRFGRGTKAASFDRQFARDMVRDHKKDISKFKRESKKSGAAANYAQQALPVLEQHLQMTESLNSSQTTGSAR